MDYDAIDKVESSIPDTSNMYNFWSDYYNNNVTISFSRSITLPASPEYIVITGDVDVMYKLPDYTETDGFYISFRIYGKKLVLYPGPTINGADQVEVTTYIYVWYK